MNEALRVVDDNNQLAKQLEQKKDVIRQTVAKGADQNEFEMFMHLAKQYGLDPFQKEIFFWKYGDKPTIVTSRDGYLKIANNHPQYDGMDSGVIYPGDEFKKTTDGVDHELNIENMNKTPLGAYAVVYRKDRKVPTRVIIPFSDYNKGNDVWSNYPSAMIQKCAESMALKRAFSVSGLVSKEEMGHDSSQQPKPGSDNFRHSEPELVEDDQGRDAKEVSGGDRQQYIDKINQLISTKSIQRSEAQKMLFDNYETNSLDNLDCNELRSYLELLKTSISDEDDSEDIAAEAAKNIS